MEMEFNGDVNVNRAAIINPSEALDRGWVRPYEDRPAIIVDPEDPECALQQNGIDLRVDEVSAADGHTVFTLNKEKDRRCNYFPLETDENDCFLFLPGRQYGVDFMEWIEVPENTCAYIFMRSSINRYSGMFFSALWDSGFRGRLGGIFRPYIGTHFQRGCRMAQVVFLRSDCHRLYDGQYQDQQRQV